MNTPKPLVVIQFRGYNCFSGWIDPLGQMHDPLQASNEFHATDVIQGTADDIRHVVINTFLVSGLAAGRHGREAPENVLLIVQGTLADDFCTIDSTPYPNQEALEGRLLRNWLIQQVYLVPETALDNLSEFLVRAYHWEQTVADITQRGIWSLQDYLHWRLAPPEYREQLVMQDGSV